MTPDEAPHGGPDHAPDDAPLVDLAASRAAADRLRGITLRTPLVAFGPPSERCFLKAESLQPIGAFKLRGAYVAVASLAPEDLRRGVWGRGARDKQLYVLLHRLRGELQEAGLDPWFLEKRRRYTRVRATEVSVVRDP